MALGQPLCNAISQPDTVVNWNVDRLAQRFPPAHELVNFYHAWKAQQGQLPLLEFSRLARFPYRLPTFIRQAGVPGDCDVPTLGDTENALRDENNALRRILHDLVRKEPDCRLRKIADGIHYWCSGTNRTQYARFAGEGKPNLGEIRKDKIPQYLATQPMILPQEEGKQKTHDNKCIACPSVTPTSLLLLAEVRLTPSDNLHRIGECCELIDSLGSDPSEGKAYRQALNGYGKSNYGPQRSANRNRAGYHFLTVFDEVGESLLPFYI
jgi:hypothetical protein